MITPSVGKDVKELGLSYTSGETIKCYNHFRKQFVSFLNSKYTPML